MIDSILTRAGAVAAGVGLLLAIASYQVGLGSWFGLVLALAIALIVGGLLALAIPLARRGRSWSATRGTPDLEARPTGGPSSDLRLVVTNRSHKGEFHGMATVVAARNYPNKLRQGSYALMWLGLGASTTMLNKGQSHAILIARWLMYMDIPPPRMGEVRLIECNGSQEAEWDGFRWNVLPDENLPEFDIDVSIVGIGWSKPFRRSYTLRPSNWIGPLELFERQIVAPEAAKGAP